MLRRKAQREKLEAELKTARASDCSETLGWKFFHGPKEGDVNQRSLEVHLVAQQNTKVLWHPLTPNAHPPKSCAGCCKNWVRDAREESLGKFQWFPFLNLVGRVACLGVNESNPSVAKELRSPWVVCWKLIWRHRPPQKIFMTSRKLWILSARCATSCWKGLNLGLFSFVLFLLCW